MATTRYTFLTGCSATDGTHGYDATTNGIEVHVRRHATGSSNDVIVGRMSLDAFEAWREGVGWERTRDDPSLWRRLVERLNPID